MRKNTEFFNSLFYMRDNISSMSKTERMIASFILREPSAVISVTLRVLSGEIGVSEGSIINFANKMNFDGFSALKLNIAQCVTPVNRQISDIVISADNGAKEAVRQVMDNLIYAFKTTVDILDANAIEKAARMILAASVIEIYGVTSSAMLASDTAYRMMKLGLPVKAVTDPLSCPISAIMLNQTSLVIAISASGRTHDLVRSINIAKEQKAGVICITSDANSPIPKLCDITLLTGTSGCLVNNFSNDTKIVQMFLIEALCSYIAALRREQSLVYQQRIDQIWQEYYQN
ncbi:MAG: MurR/RpiR family transcriptional regulator [Eubacteriales bacterium]